MIVGGILIALVLLIGIYVATRHHPVRHSIGLLPFLLPN
jgi:hypothetical protein